MNGGNQPAPHRAYHKMVRVTAASTAVLIGAGALVTTTGSGLSVPDWPTTFGTFFPAFDLWVNGVEFEHTHRLIAGCVALMMLVSGVWVLRREERRGVRVLAGAAMGAVLMQAVLGGLTVLLKLPPAVSVSHGTLAQTFFSLIVALSLATSPAWAEATRNAGDDASATLKLMAALLTVTVWVQLIIGATMRHLHAGLAIPDFPLSQEHLVPTYWSTAVAVNFAHRVGALVVFLLATSVVGFVLVRFRDDRRLVRAALQLGLFVLLQVTLGAYTVWTARSTFITSLHVLNGALVLVSSVLLTLWAFRLYGPREVAAERTSSPRVTPAMQGAAR